MDAMKKESQNEIQYLGVDGGASVNDYMMQFQADLLNAKLIRPTCFETTALGATYFAGLATGVFKSKDEIKKLHQVEQIFMSRIDDEMRDKLIKGWKKAVDATLKFK